MEPYKFECELSMSAATEHSLKGKTVIVTGGSLEQERGLLLADALLSFVLT